MMWHQTQQTKEAVLRCLPYASSVYYFYLQPSAYLLGIFEVPSSCHSKEIGWGRLEVDNPHSHMLAPKTRNYCNQFCIVLHSFVPKRWRHHLFSLSVYCVH